MIPATQPNLVSSFPRSLAHSSCEKSAEEESYNQFKSQSIPICKNLHRTASELQLCADEQLADQRDFAFFSRLVNGISKSQTSGTSGYLQMENQVCLAHIFQTRHEQQQKPQQPQWPNQQTQEEWGHGLADNDYIYSITSEAIALASPDQEDDDGAIFDLDM